MDNTPQPGESSVKKTSNNSSWFLWWQVSDEDVKSQVDGYNTLKFHQTARGLSFLLLLLSAVTTTLFIIFNLISTYAFVDVIVFLVVGVFILKGHRWASMAAMIIWTIEKAASIDTKATTIVVSLIWWALYMHQFYIAFKVEKARSLLKSETAPAVAQ